MKHKKSSKERKITLALKLKKIDMKNLILHMMIKEIETKIFDALIGLGLKSPKVLAENQECHFITQKKLNKNLSNYSLQFFCCSPLYNKIALESVQMWTFILRPDFSGRGISADGKFPLIKIYDITPFSLN